VHRFRKVDDSTTEVIDEIDFQLHYSWLGRMFEGYVYSQLKKIFEHRKHATIKALES
jgi:ligand-binding SRPBCC domain-containing protein